MGFFDKNILKALNHNKKMEEKFEHEIQNSLKQTIIYTDSNLNYESRGESPAQLSLTCVPTAEAIIELRKNFPDKNITALNFADYKNPGGGYLCGAMAQEEGLCHRSDLYQVEKRLFEDYYRFNLKNLNNEIYLDRALYTPNIIFDEKYPVNIITCAAPNFRRASQKYQVPYIEACQALKRRMIFVKKIAENQQSDILILGAWGAGCFGFRTQEVVKLWQEVWNEKTTISNVVFAVISRHDNNADKFFEEWLG